METEKVYTNITNINFIFIKTKAQNCFIECNDLSLLMSIGTFEIYDLFNDEVHSKHTIQPTEFQVFFF